MKNLGLLLLIGLCSSVLAKDGDVWIGTWATNPTGLPNVERLGTFTLPVPTIVKGTVRYRLRISQGGTEVRLRFSNEYSDKPLTINAATVGLAAAGLNAAPGSLKVVTFGDRSAITIPAGAPALSDAVPASRGDIIRSGGEHPCRCVAGKLLPWQHDCDRSRSCGEKTPMPLARNVQRRCGVRF